MSTTPELDQYLSLPADADWLQWLDRPPLASSTALAGHVTVVLVWRLASAHGLAALAEVAAVAAEFVGEPVALLSLHVPLEAAERDPDRLRRALAGTALPLPTATVTRRSALRRLGVGALPTLLLVDASARIVSRAVGVPRRSRLREAVVGLLDEARSSGRAALAPFAAHALASQPTLHPTAIATVDDELWIVSQAQRRVLRCHFDGRVTAIVGSGAAGAADGPADTASWVAPSAICAHDGYLAVADAGSHTLRAIDRTTLEVTTWCGKGRLSDDITGGAYGRDQGLSSPSGIASRDGGLYLSQAGTDQIWQIDPMTGAGIAWFGAAENRGVALREPRGLGFVDDTLWLCEAGGGELTAIDLSHLRSDPGLIGLARPVALTVHRQRLLVAVAWQPAVLLYDPGAAVQKVLFDEHDGLVEPVALACSGDRLFVADAGADRIWTADLAADRPQLTAIELLGATAPAAASAVLAQIAPPLLLRADSDVTVLVPATGLANGIEVSIDVVDEAAETLAAPRHVVVAVHEGSVRVLVPTASAIEGVWRIRLVAGAEQRRFLVSVRLSDDGAMMAALLPAS